MDGRGLRLGVVGIEHLHLFEMVGGLAEVGAVSVGVPHAPRGGERLSGQGTVNSVSGACPSVTFTIMGHRVEATVSTQYTAGGCGQLREGAAIKLDVDKQPDGTIYAESIEFLGVSGGRE